MDRNGRPSLTDQNVDIIFRKLEPHLKSGLSLHKACLQAQVPKSTVYELCYKNRQFSEKIDTARSYHTVLVTSILTKHLESISKKQNKGSTPSLEDIRFVQWTATNTKSMRDEYGADMELTIEDKKREEDEATMRMFKEDPDALKVVIESFAIVADKLKVDASKDISNSLSN